MNDDKGEAKVLRQYEIIVERSYDEVPQPRGEFVNLFEKYKMISKEKSEVNIGYLLHNGQSDAGDVADQS